MSIKKIREVSADEENFRIESDKYGFQHIRRDGIKPVPVGSFVVMVFEVTGYDRDCDGSLMARLANIDCDGKETGWDQNCISLSPGSSWEIDSPDDLDKLS